MASNQHQAMKHEAFESNYRPDFEVVEQRHGKVHCYPHTDQLPVLFRALNFEFKGGLPPRLARVDHRADGFHKVILRMASLMFCNSINGTRPDQLHLHALPDHDLVFRPMIVQHITEESRRGPCHSFKFYGGENWFHEIYFCGKRVLFADHVLSRFSSRVSSRFGDDLSTFLLTFYGGPIFAMKCGRGFAFVMQHGESLLAFPFEETDDEFFLKSCLTVHEISDLTFHLPPYTIDRHYDLPYKVPEVRNWYPLQWAMNIYKAWRNKGRPHETKWKPWEKKEWSYMGHWVQGYVEREGHGPGSQLLFQDGIPGPGILDVRPNEVAPQYREEESYKQTRPNWDWDEAYARRRAEKRIGENEFKS